MKIKAIPVLISIFVLLVLANCAGCIRKVPYDSFNSLQELKKSLENSNVLFPDMQKYVFEESAMYHKIYKGKSNIVTGYQFGGKLNPAESDTHLWKLYISCRIIDAEYDERNPAPPIKANTKILGTDVYEKITEELDDPNSPTLNWYPEGSKIVSYYYEFNYGACRYDISGTLVIPPEEFKAMDTYEIDAMVQSGKNEIICLVESVIKQKN